jgi:signal transduction histidine kinase
MIAVTDEVEPLPADTESRLGQFTELVATAIANAEARGQVSQLVEEQAALRRVATLVARGVAPTDVFEAIAREAGRLLGVDAMHMGRYDAGAAISVAGWSRAGDPLPVGTRVELDGRNIASLVLQSGRPARIDGYSTPAAADEERRRVVRDLHDGAQQRLVHTIVTMKLARGALDEGDDARPTLAEALDQAEQANTELRELAHGIRPTVLARGGLRAGLEALASRTPVPVDIGVDVGRLPPTVEATAYFVAAEALTNVAKHARAQRAQVTAWVDDAALRLRVRDDGVGGARADGSGLVGLADRVAALGGRFRVESPAGSGTLVAADIPARDEYD